MANKITARVPRGMRDLLPEQMLVRRYVFDVITSVFESYGFQPLQTPVLELAETLMGKYGPDAQKLIYEAGHAGGKEQLALRYDLTVPLARLVGMYGDLPLPFKRYQIAPVWRAERPSKGRYREFYQCDADTVGVASVLADAEIVSMMVEIYNRLGFTNYRTILNNRKILTGLGQYAGVPGELLGGLYRSIDKLERIGFDGVREELTANDIPGEVADRLLGLLEASGGDNLPALAAIKDELGDFEIAVEGATELEEMLAYLEVMGVNTEVIAVDFSMVRGLGYYTGPIFETVVEEPRIGSITGGGRYDELLGMFSKQSLPMTGTSLGIERIVDVMTELEMLPPSVGKTVTQVLVTVFDESTRDASLGRAAGLRQAGLNTEVYFRGKDKLGKQLSYASRRGIGYAVILGPDEIAQGQATVKNMDTKEQVTLAQDALADQIYQWMG
jgi:histidyl-tRNA synthetase